MILDNSLDCIVVSILCFVTGGRVIQRECEDYIRNNGSLSEGEVFMSSGGKLICKRVAHAVGPHWRGGNNGEESCLQAAVFACIEETEKETLASIALPALSAGMFQYPVNLSCMAIAKAIDQHFQVNTCYLNIL